MKIFVALILVINVAACNTIAGLGTDITKSSDWTKEKMK